MVRDYWQQLAAISCDMRNMCAICQLGVDPGNIGVDLMAQADGNGQNREIVSFKRGLLILDLFLSSPGKLLSISDVARVLGIRRASAFRLLTTLKTSGYLESADPSGLFSLGTKWRFSRERVYDPGPSFLMVVSILKQLADETGEGAALGVLYKGEVMLVHAVDGPHSVRTHQLVGISYPAHLQAMGKVLLAGLDDSALDEWLQGRTLSSQTSNSLTSPQRLRAELAMVRRWGYAVDEDEYELGLTCVGAPVRDLAGNTIAAVAVSGPSSRISYHRIPELVAATKRAGEEMSFHLTAYAAMFHYC